MKAGNAMLALGVVLIGAAAVLYLAPVAVRAPSLLVTEAAAQPLAGADDDLGLYLQIENRGGPDRLVGAWSPDAAAVAIAGARSTDGLPIPADSAPSLAAGGAFLRLSGLTGGQDDGRMIPLTLVFENAGGIATRARLSMPGGDDAAVHAMDGMNRLYEVPEDEPVPRIGMLLRPDGDGWSITLELKNVTLSAEQADGPHRPGTGHVHLYLDGLKLQRMYTTAARLGALPPGEHELRAALNTNNHQTYAVNGEPVMALARMNIR